MQTLGVVEDCLCLQANLTKNPYFTLLPKLKANQLTLYTIKEKDKLLLSPTLGIHIKWTTGDR